MKQKTKHLWAAIAVGGLGVVMLVVALRSATVSVWATEGRDGAIAPLALSNPTVDGLSAADWAPVIQDKYDGSYESTYHVPRVVGTTGAPYQWGPVTAGGNPFEDTLWCVQGWSGASLVAGTDVYTDGVDTTITYGPIDLSDVISVSLSFRYWVSTAAGDGLEWGVSTSGVPQTYQPVTPSAEGAWEVFSRDGEDMPALADLVGEESVYLSFRFYSDDDGQVDLGAFLDDVTLWGWFDLKTLHMPVVWRTDPTATPTTTPTPTATPTPQGFSDDFSDVTSGWPREWERQGSNINIRGGYLLDRTRLQVWDELMANQEALGGDMSAQDLQAAEVRFLAEEDEVYYAVLHDAWDRAFIAGPYVASGDFDLEVRARYNYVQRWFQGNRYGVLLSKEPVNPEDPHTIHGFSFQVEILPQDDGENFATPWWRFKEWYRTNWVGDDGGDEDRTAADDPSAAIHSRLGQWNTLRIERRGTSFNLYINGTFVRTVTDSDNTGPYYVGLMARHTGSGTTELSYDVLVEWDDVSVTLR